MTDDVDYDVDYDVECPACGSADICREPAAADRHRGGDVYVCDHCGHEWDD